MAPPSRPDPWDPIRAELEAGRLRPAYLFHGAEPWLVERARDLAVATARPAGPRGFNRDDFHGSDSSPATIATVLATLPMMASHRLVVVRSIEALKGDHKPLLAWLGKPVDPPGTPPRAVLVATAGRLTREGGATNWLKAVAQHGAAVEFKPLYDRSLIAWVRAEAVRRRKPMTDEAAHYLVEMCGSGLASLSGEIDKACLYVGDRPGIQLSDLEEVVADLRMSTVFELAQALAERDVKSAVLAIDRAFVQDRDPSLPLLAAAARHFRMMLAVRDELEAGVEERAAVARNGGLPQMAWKIVPSIRRWTPEAMRSALLRIHRAEQTTKSSRSAGRLLVERLAMEICQRDGRGRA